MWDETPCRPVSWVKGKAWRAGLQLSQRAGQIWVQPRFYSPESCVWEIEVNYPKKKHTNNKKTQHPEVISSQYTSQSCLSSSLAKCRAGQSRSATADTKRSWCLVSIWVWQNEVKTSPAWSDMMQASGSYPAHREDGRPPSPFRVTLLKTAREALML